MGKTGWQAVAFVGIGLSLLLGGFALNTRNALEAATSQLRQRSLAHQACEPNELANGRLRADDGTGTHPDYQAAQLIREIERDGAHRCIRGQLFEIREGEWIQQGNCPRYSYE